MWRDPTWAARRRLIDARKAAREGRRYYAFYRGCRDAKAGRQTNPFPSGSEEAACWEKGRQYGGEEA